MHRTLTSLAAIFVIAGLTFAGQGQPAPKKADVIQELRRDFDEARGRLQKDDSGPETRAAHRRIIEGIDKLLDQQDPDKSPPSSPPMQPPTDSSSAPKENPSTPRSNLPAPKGNQPMPKTTPVPHVESSPEVRPAPRSEAPENPRANADGPWDVSRLRRANALDALGRERSPRYEELLRAYYRSLAAGRGED